MVLSRRPRHDSEDIEETISEDEVEVGEFAESEGELSSAEEDNHGDEGAENPVEIRRSPRLIALLEERDRLRQQRIEEELLLQQEIARRDAVLEDVRRLEERRRQLMVVRRRDLEELAALEREANSDGEPGANGGSEGEME